MRALLFDICILYKIFICKYINFVESNKKFLRRVNKGLFVNWTSLITESQKTCLKRKKSELLKTLRMQLQLVTCSSVFMRRGQVDRILYKY